MAGIGFSLKRLFSKKGVFALCRAYGYAALTSTGPVLLGFLLLAGISFAAGLGGLGRQDRELLNSMITYSLLVSLTVTSWLNMAVTRYVSDMLYEEKPERVMPSFYGSCALMLPVGGAGYAVFLAFSGAGLLHGLLCLWFSLILTVVWTQTVYLTALKDYKGIVVIFFAALLAGFAMAFLCVMAGLAKISAFFLCVILAYGLMMAGYDRLLSEYFPKREGSCFSFLHWLRRFPALPFIGGFLNIGMFSHLAVMYFGPLAVQVEGLFYSAPAYEIPAVMAFFSILVMNVHFVTSAEVRFYPRYRGYYSLYNDKGSIRDMKQAEREMLTVVRQELSFGGCKQLISTILFVVFGGFLLGLSGVELSDTVAGIFRFQCVGYGIFAVGQSVLLFMLYFEDYAGACAGAAALALFGTAGTIWQATR